MSRVRGCVALCLLVLTGCATRDSGAPVVIPAKDGVALKGSYYSPAQVAQGAGVVLFHQCNWDRTSWAPLATALAAAGFHVLTVDQRGFGESGGVRTPSDNPILAADADAAFENLAGRPGVDRMRLAAGGASCGVAQAVDLATRQHDLKAVMALSGDASKRGLGYVTATPSLAIFGAVSDGDDSAADTRAIAAASKNPLSTMKVFEGGSWLDSMLGRHAHGVDMFDEHPELMPEVVAWLRERTVSPPASSPSSQ